MPFYEYQCEACGKHHEAMRKMSDPALRKCPACGKLRLKRLLSAPVFRLKGGGWYETDFKSDKEGRRNLAADDGKAETRAEDKAGALGDAKPAAAEGGPAAAGSEAKADAKSDSKPATKPDSKPESRPDAGAAPKSGGGSQPAPPAGARRAPRRATKVVPARKPPGRGTARARGSRGRR